MGILLKPKEVELTDQDGVTRTYIVSRLPAVQGREIVTQYPLSAMPKVGDYAVNEGMMLKLMSYVAVRKDDGTDLQLTTRALIDNHVGDWETLAKLEVAMMEYNVSFFRDGRALNFFEAIARKAQPWISRMLTDLSAQSSRKEKPP
jgi:hypothetical protein